jgi:hypothetical protein
MRGTHDRLPRLVDHGDRYRRAQLGRVGDDRMTRFWQDGNPIIQVEIDTHRWYSVITVTYENDEKAVRVIANADGSGMCEFDSIDDFFAAVD